MGNETPSRSAIATLTAGVLITFYAIEDTRPSGADAMTILWDVFGVSLAWVALQDVCIARLRRAAALAESANQHRLGTTMRIAYVVGA